MADIHRMLGDRASFPDSYVIKTADGDVNLGEFRAAFSAREAALDEQRKQLRDDATALANGRMEVANFYQTVAAEKEDLAAKRAELEAMRSTVTTTWNKETAESNDRVAQLETAIKGYKEELDKISGQVKSASEQFVFDRFKDDFHGEELPKGMKEQDVIKYAQERNLRRGWLPDIKAALRELRAPEEWDKKIKAAEEAGYQRRANEDALRAINGNSRVLLSSEQPTGSPIKITPGMDTAQILDASITAAANDPEIKAHLAGLIPAPTA